MYQTQVVTCKDMQIQTSAAPWRVLAIDHSDLRTMSETARFLYMNKFSDNHVYLVAWHELNDHFSEKSDRVPYSTCAAFKRPV